MTTLSCRIFLWLSFLPFYLFLTILTLLFSVQVSWVGPDHSHDNRNVNLLTVGTDTYTPDRRFRGLHVSTSPEWTLQIKGRFIYNTGILFAIWVDGVDARRIAKQSYQKYLGYFFVAYVRTTTIFSNWQLKAYFEDEENDFNWAFVSPVCPATTLEDAGNYECQLSSTPLRTHVIRLHIIGKSHFASNNPSLYSTHILKLDIDSVLA
jgi:hypothetical protein